MSTFRTVNRLLTDSKPDEKKVLALLAEEVKSLRRPSVVRRLYARMNRLRRSRELKEYLS